MITVINPYNINFLTLDFNSVISTCKKENQSKQTTEEQIKAESTSYKKWLSSYKNKEAAQNNATCYVKGLTESEQSTAETQSTAKTYLM